MSDILTKKEAIEFFGLDDKIFDNYFKNAKPVSTLVEINKTVKEGCDIEIEVIAVK